MRRILKWLAQLYPAAWRARYGAEYEALLEEREPRVRDVVDVAWGAMKMQMTAWGSARIVLGCALAGVAVAVAISFVAPKKYLSQTLISVETPDRQAIDKYLAGLVKDGLSPEFVTSIIERENLYPSERARMPLSDAVDLMRKNILIRAVNGKQPSGFVVEFVYPDPRVAQRVDKELVSQLMALNLGTAIANSSDPARPRVTFRVDHAADLPQRPVFPKRSLFGVGGLFAGLVSGLILAVVVGTRRGPMVAKG